MTKNKESEIERNRAIVERLEKHLEKIRDMSNLEWEYHYNPVEELEKILKGDKIET